MSKIFELITELIGWIQIVISPTLIGIGLGFIVYYNFPNSNGLIIGILITLIALITGILLATKKFKTTGTVNFLSRISATPELDEIKDSKSKKN